MGGWRDVVWEWGEQRGSGLSAVINGLTNSAIWKGKKIFPPLGIGSWNGGWVCPSPTECCQVNGPYCR